MLDIWEYRGDFLALLLWIKSRGEGIEPVLKTQREVVSVVETVLRALDKYEGLLLGGDPHSKLSKEET